MFYKSLGSNTLQPEAACHHLARWGQGQAELGWFHPPRPWACARAHSAWGKRQTGPALHLDWIIIGYIYNHVSLHIYIRQMPGLCPEPQPRQATHHHHHHHHQSLIEDLQWMQKFNRGGKIKPLLKIFNECRSLTGVGEFNPYWRSSMNVKFNGGGTLTFPNTFVHLPNWM